MSFFNRMSHVVKKDADPKSIAEAVTAVEKANPHRHGDGSGRFATPADSRVGTGARDPKSQYYSPYHLVRDPEPNSKNTYRVHHGDNPLTESMPRSQAANEYAKMLEKARPYIEQNKKLKPQTTKYVEQNSTRTSTESGPGEPGGKGRNNGQSEERGNATG